MPASTVDHVDVLIVGAGPAGLMAANWLAHMGVNVRIVDKRGTKVFNGQADGLHVRTLEIFSSFGIYDRIRKEANPMSEVHVWFPAENGTIKRGSRFLVGSKGISHIYPGCVLHQGRIERFLLDSIKDVSDIGVERGILPIKMDYDPASAEDSDAYPITIHLQHLEEADARPQQNLTSIPDGLFRSNLAADDTDDLIRRTSGKEGTVETVKAKYMIGADGAHSWVRRQLGYELHGEATESIWGVLDILPITDFPDIRFFNTIHSKDHGTILLIPRERGLVRLYVQLKEVHPEADGRADRSKITPSTILATAKNILSPFKIDYKYCDWWTAYQIGQRFGRDYSKDNRIFIAGDACHTHSPKSGQGMNVSMQDTFNLGWKLGLVLKGMSPRSILGTYQSERSWVAEALINMDHEVTRLMMGNPVVDTDGNGTKLSDMTALFQRFQLFQSGTALEYGRSLLVAKPADPNDAANGDGNMLSSSTPTGKPELASNIKMGQRIPSYRVLNHSSGDYIQFSDWMNSDGRFRVILFAGNVAGQGQLERVKQFCARLDEKDSFLRRVTPQGADIDSVIQILTLHSTEREEMDWIDFPEILRPFDAYRGYNYSTIAIDDDSLAGQPCDAYRSYGVDPSSGCVVVLRPDHHVAFIGNLEDVGDLDRYFGSVLLPAEKHREGLPFKRREKSLGASSAVTNEVLNL